MFNPDNRRCASCEHYATYPGVCCNTKSQYAAGERDGYHSCDFWEERIEGKFNKKSDNLDGLNGLKQKVKDRLTERIQRQGKEDLIVFRSNEYRLGCLIPAEMTKDSIRAVLKKLADYEDLGYTPTELTKLLEVMNQDKAEKKIMIELPCEIGDTVYIIGSKYRHGQVEKWVNTGKFRLSDMEKLNATVFLTEEAARQKLKEI